MEKDDKEDLLKRAKSRGDMELILDEYRLKLHKMKSTEIKILQEINEQQLITKEALTKFYNYKEEALQERER